MPHDYSSPQSLLTHPFYMQSLRSWGAKPARPIVMMDDRGCLRWQGTVNSKGYPCNGHGLVHRQAWEAFHGPLPAGRHVHHVCGNKTCVSVLCLEALTPDDHRRLEGQQKLDEYKVRQILVLVANGVTHSRIAELFGIRKSYVSHIKLGRVWKDVVQSFWRAQGGSPPAGRITANAA